MWPSYRLVVRLIRPILERPKSVSLMCPMEVISRLRRGRERERNIKRERETETEREIKSERKKIRERVRER